MEEATVFQNSKSYTLYSNVEKKEIKWLWYPYIPYGKITLLQGDPGDGKSTFMINVAACLTTGADLPDGTPIEDPMNVVYQCAEDGISDTVKPRLVNAGADCDRVAFIDDENSSLTINDNRIEQVIKAFSARLLILDPLQAFLSPDMDMQSAIRMRATLRKIAAIAEKYECAVVLIGHMNKSNGGKSLYRSLGSIDITAIARSVLMIARDEIEREIRYVIPVKSSLAPEGNVVSFMLDKEKGFQWIGKCINRTPDINNVAQITHNKREKAKELLRVILSTGDIAATDIMEKMLDYGICERTIRSAAKEIGVINYKSENRWYWKLDTENEDDLEE